jgi:hypothetical protein
MIPTTAATLLAFVLFIVPGLVFELIRDRKRVSIERSTFRELAWVILVGLAASTVSVLILSGVRKIGRGTMPDVGSWIASPRPYFQHHYALIVGDIAVEVLLASVLAALVGFAMQRKPVFRTLPDPALWLAFNKGISAKGEPYVTIKQEDGSVLTGVARCLDWRATDSEFIILESPLQSAVPGPGQLIAQPSWSRVAVPFSTMTQIWIKFVEAATHGPETDDSNQATQ